MEQSSIPGPGSQSTAIEKVIAFIDERVGLKLMLDKMLNEPVPGGSRWAYVFGSVLLFLFIMQALTGILLMFYYAPTIDHAYASTQYIIHDVDYGWFLLSYHFWGSTAMAICVVVHMSQVFLWGSYKSPRELLWLVGLALFGIVWSIGVFHARLNFVPLSERRREKTEPLGEGATGFGLRFDLSF